MVGQLLREPRKCKPTVEPVARSVWLSQLPSCPLQLLGEVLLFLTQAFPAATLDPRTPSSPEAVAGKSGICYVLYKLQGG